MVKYIGYQLVNLGPKQDEHTPSREGPKIYQIIDCSISKPTRYLNDVHGIDKNGKISDDQRIINASGLDVTGFPILLLLFKVGTWTDSKSRILTVQLNLVFWFVSAQISFAQVENNAFCNFFLLN